MAKFIDLTGMKFGLLTVERRFGKNKHGHITWLCKCECGAEVTVSSSNLKSGHTKSCKCVRIERIKKAGAQKKLATGESAFNSLFRIYRIGAQKRSLAWEIDRDLFRETVNQPCYYCGKEPSNTMYAGGKAHHNGSYTYNGIDRIDNSKGYTPENIRPCCKQCNLAKRDLSEEEFYTWLNRVIAMDMIASADFSSKLDFALSMEEHHREQLLHYKRLRIWLEKQLPITDAFAELLTELSNDNYNRAFPNAA